MSARRWTKQQKRRGIAKGYRSGLEEAVAKQLEDAEVNYQYEPWKIPYMVPATEHKYTIDFVLSNGILVETKGRFTVEDRKKHLYIQKQYPELDIRFVFTNPNTKINKRSKTSYADWCAKHGFQFAKKFIPKEWLEEEANWRSLQQINKIVRE